MLRDIESSAAALYDGGWRATDRDELIAEYDLTDTEADAICAKLAEYDTRYYGAKTTSGELIVMSVSDLEPSFLQGAETSEFSSNVDMWEPLPDDFDDAAITEWLTKEALISYLSR